MRKDIDILALKAKIYEIKLQGCADDATGNDSLKYVKNSPPTRTKKAVELAKEVEVYEFFRFLLSKRIKTTYHKQLTIFFILTDKL